MTSKFDWTWGILFTFMRSMLPLQSLENKDKNVCILPCQLNCSCEGKMTSFFFIFFRGLPCLDLSTPSPLGSQYEGANVIAISSNQFKPKNIKLLLSKTKAPCQIAQYVHFASDSRLDFWIYYLVGFLAIQFLYALQGEKRQVKIAL